jgi:hypothetical protein
MRLLAMMLGCIPGSGGVNGDARSRRPTPTSADMQPRIMASECHRAAGRDNEVASATKTASGARFTSVTPPTLDAEPACPGFANALTAPAASRRVGPTFHAERRRVADIPRATWDALAARTPWATPFSSWAFQRAWWDAYEANAHDETLIVCTDGPTGDEPIAIVPLMHRHEVEPGDALTHTTIRHGRDLELTPVEPTATAVFFGASYHADYATILAAPEDLPVVAEAVADHLVDTAGRST